MVQNKEMRIENNLNYQIRQMKESDLLSVYDLVQSTIQVSYLEVYPTEAIEFFKNYHEKDNILKDAITGYTIIVQSGGEIIATGTLIGTNIRRVFVRPNFQNQGIGKSVVKRLEEKASLDKLSTLDLSASLISRHFWESLGFTFLRENFLPVPNGKKLIFYEMEKHLHD